MTERTAQRRSRFSVAEKREIVAQLQRLGTGGRPLPEHIRAVAAQYGVTVRAVQMWLNDPALAPSAVPPAVSSNRFEVTVDMLTVVGNEQNRRTAWEKLHAAGIVTVSYATCRALAEADPALVAAAVDGYKGMVNTRPYLKTVAPHRCWAYHVDHTQLDLYVSPSHKHTKSLVRPWVTVIVDAATGFLCAFPWYQPVNGSMVAAALAQVCIEHECRCVAVGGMPEQVVLDNAGEHFTEQMAAAATRLGLVLAPTNARSSWQNGKAERAVRLLTDRFANRAPGAINAGTTRQGGSRFLVNERDKTSRDGPASANAN